MKNLHCAPLRRIAMIFYLGGAQKWAQFLDAFLATWIGPWKRCKLLFMAEPIRSLYDDPPDELPGLQEVLPLRLVPIREGQNTRLSPHSLTKQISEKYRPT